MTKKPQKPIKLRYSELLQLRCVVTENELSGEYYGNARQYEQRTKNIKDWIAQELELLKGKS